MCDLHISLCRKRAGNAGEYVVGRVMRSVLSVGSICIHLAEIPGALLEKRVESAKSMAERSDFRISIPEHEILMPSRE